MEESLLQKILETALLCAEQPMKVGELSKLFIEEDNVSNDVIKQQLQALQTKWRGKGVELVEISGGWRFQSHPDMQKYLERLSPEKPPKYSRAVLETLAIIAWHQPVTRGDIEDIRGVTVSSQIIKTLEERGWIEVIGHKEGPGRPALLGTTSSFLSDMNLKSLSDLPAIEADVNVLMSNDETLAQLFQEQQLSLIEQGKAVEQSQENQNTLIDDIKLSIDGIDHESGNHQVISGMQENISDAKNNMNESSVTVDKRELSIDNVPIEISVKNNE